MLKKGKASIERLKIGDKIQITNISLIDDTLGWEDGNILTIIGIEKEYERIDAKLKDDSLSEYIYENEFDGIALLEENLKEEDLLKMIDDWIQKGFVISYYVINQIENGYMKQVHEGFMPKYTYTFYVERYEDEAGSEPLWQYSVDSFKQGCEMAIKWLRDNY